MVHPNHTHLTNHIVVFLSTASKCFYNIIEIKVVNKMSTDSRGTESTLDKDMAPADGNIVNAADGEVANAC